MRQTLSLAVPALLLALAIACAAPPATNRPPTNAPPTSAADGIVRAIDPTATIPYDLVAVDFVDATHGWIAGSDEGNNVSTILRTEDGGRTWVQLVEILGDTLYDVDFADATFGWAVGVEGYVYATADGGRTWTGEIGSAWSVQRDEPFEKIPSKSAPSTVLEIGETVVSFFFFDASHGFAAGDVPTDDLDARRRLLVETVDGGKTWRPVGDEASSSFAINDLFFSSPTDGWAAGGTVAMREEDVLFATTDGGKRWERRRTGAAQFLRAVHFVDARRGWVDGLTIDPTTETFGPSKLLGTRDGGTTWRAELTVDRSLFDVTFADAGTGWAVGERAAVFATTDGGATWTQQSAFDASTVVRMNRPGKAGGANPPRALNAIAAVDATNVWTGGAGVIYKRPAGGR
jgi:photosystem II stability/assembly factor-like uncharacterized protein